MDSANKLNVLYSETGSLGFNNPSHFGNFLNYLYRTDKAQKNTNHLTENCFTAVVTEDDVLILPFGDLEDRLENRQKKRRFLGELTEIVSGKKTSPCKYFINKIVYVSFLDDNENDIKSKVSKEQVQEIMKDVILNIHDEKNYLYVAHLDQDDDYHIHVVSLKS